ncbi:hypothetical protein LP414_27385 [Polaromonas sp. P1(28)-13]|nr:hypothetical protein LP414_27385 [Polaromonas sp. P1(28)-13]
MGRGAINFYGTWLMSGSHAHKLHTEGKLKELSAHMKQLDINDRKLKGETP